MFRFVLIGNSVGKSSLLIRWADSTYTEAYGSTISVDFKIRTLEVRGKKIKIQAWDSLGREKFRDKYSNNYDSHAAIITFDLTDKSSFDEIKKWLAEFRAKNKLAI